MNLERKKLRGFVVGENCYFYDYDFNLLFWKVSKLINFSKKVIEEDGVCYDVEFFTKTKIKEEYLKGDGSVFKPMLMSVQANVNRLEFIFGGIKLSNSKKLEFKKANARFDAKISEENKFSAFLGILFLVNNFFDSEDDAESEDGSKVRALEVSFSKNLVDSGVCCLLPAARLQAESLDGEISDSSWIFHEKFSFFSKCKGIVKNEKLSLKV